MQFGHQRTRYGHDVSFDPIASHILFDGMGVGTLVVSGNFSNDHLSVDAFKRWDRTALDGSTVSNPCGTADLERP